MQRISKSSFPRVNPSARATPVRQGTSLVQGCSSTTADVQGSSTSDRKRYLVSLLSTVSTPEYIFGLRIDRFKASDVVIYGLKTTWRPGAAAIMLRAAGYRAAEQYRVHLSSSPRWRK